VSAASEPGAGLHLPDFCSARATLLTLLLVVLGALALTLMQYGTGLNFWVQLGRTALLLAWIGLGSVALLCLLHAPLTRLSVSGASLLALLAVAAVSAAVSLGAIWLADHYVPLATRTLWLPHEDTRLFVGGNVAVSLIVGALALRHFQAAGEWRRQLRVAARAQLYAQTARLPYALRLALPAALGASDAAQRADVLALYRANQEEARERVPLAEELERAHLYQRLESARLGPRLQVVWDVADLPPGALVPHLLMQTLLDVAIGHGLEPRGGGTLTVSGALDRAYLGLTVRSPLPEAEAPVRAEARAALAGLRDRLEVMYHGRAQLDAGREADEYRLRVRLPYSAAADA